MAHHNDRARELLARMTLKEKIAQLMSVWLTIDESGGYALKEGNVFALKDTHRDIGEALAERDRTDFAAPRDAPDRRA